jgi:hypothetical protein
MQTSITTTTTKTSVGVPTYEYESMTRLWKRSRAVLNGELYAKAHDAQLDNLFYTNLLVPFSPSMSQAQYRWYVAEGELPGLVAQYAKTLAGGLLRKQPLIVLPDALDDSAKAWIQDRFTQDGRSILAFLDDAIWEEMVTSRAFVSVDFPTVTGWEEMSPEQRDNINPYPVLWRAEDVINWQVTTHPETGRPRLSRVVFRYINRDYERSQHHADLEPRVADHFIDDSGVYRVQYYKKEGEANLELTNGDLRMTEMFGYELFANDNWIPEGEPLTPMMWGEPLTELPIFPLNGEIALETPMLTPLIDREIALYNKVSRRNHLLYGAATYTPVMFSSISDDEFNEVVSRGLGTWIKLNPEDRVEVLKPPTEALSDMDRSIDAAVDEMARMGIRLMSPETQQSGVALEIRNSSQTAQLGVLNTKISSTMRRVISLMLRWKYGRDLDVTEVEFTMSSDFNASPVGPEWLKLVWEWYSSRAIPRSVFIRFLKQHDIIPADYDDDEGIAEIGQDFLTEPTKQVTIDEGDED